MKKFLPLLILAAAICITLSCHGMGDNPTPKPPADTTITLHSGFAKGADISWVTQMESSGLKFYDKTGKQTDLFQLMKSLGMNSIRLRAWVNPTDGWCNTADLVAKAKRANALGMRIMIDLHYSDVWADPGHQTKPATWAALDFTTLQSTLKSYTTTVMNALKTAGITPEWVQVGNETNDGMLWEDGRASKSMANFAALVNAGYDGVKAIFPDAKVIVHISNGFDNTLFRWMFDGLKANNARYDVIGMSLYPPVNDFASYDTNCVNNVHDMVSRYDKPVMICEVGMDVGQPAVAKAFLTDIISRINGVSNNQGLGVFYWEPESYNWQQYNLGAFDSSGKPTAAMDAFSVTEK